jgi:hypothetical protein
MRAWALLLVAAGCRLPPPAPADLEFVRQIPPPPGPYARVTAVADLESEKLSGTFDVLLLAKTGPRLQLLPDLGGKAVDLAAGPDRLSGRLPHTGESIEWTLPEDARAHPLLFMAITLLERFAPIREERVSGARDGELDLRPVVNGASVRWRDGEWRLGWGVARWTRRAEEVVAPGFQLKLRNVKVEALATLDEGLLRLK